MIEACGLADMIPEGAPRQSHTHRYMTASGHEISVWVDSFGMVHVSEEMYHMILTNQFHATILDDLFGTSFDRVDSPRESEKNID